MPPAPRITVPEGIDARDYITRFAEETSRAVTAEEARAAIAKLVDRGLVSALDANVFLRLAMKPGDAPEPTFVDGQV